MCTILMAGISCSISPARAWSDETNPYPEPLPGNSAPAHLDESRLVNKENAARNYQALYNWRMTEKKSFSMGVMVRQDPVYLNNDNPTGIAIFRYRVKF